MMNYSVNKIFERIHKNSLSKQHIINIFNKYADKLLQNKQKLAEICTKETGYPIKYTLNQIDSAVDFLTKIDKLHIISPKNTIICPAGTILLTIPSNDPIEGFINPIVPALLMRNQIIVKSSSKCVETSRLLVKLLLNSGCPKYNLQFATLNRKEIKELIIHPELDLIYWVGGSKSAKSISKLAGEYNKRYIIESEGNNWCYLDKSYTQFSEFIDIIINSLTAHNGQMCNAISGVFIHTTIFDKIVANLKKQLDNIIRGSAFDKHTELSPLDKEVENTLKEKIKSTGGITIRSDKSPWPAIIINPSMNSELVLTESFGPLMWLKSVQNEQQVINLMKMNKYGLCFSIFTNKDNIEWIKELKVARININSDPLHVSFFEPWGGYRLSGNVGPMEWLNKFSTIKYINKNEIKK